MLANNADDFYLRPMRTTVVHGGNVGNQTPMPAPREASVPATRSLMLPGVGADPAPSQPSNKEVVKSIILNVALFGGALWFALSKKSPLNRR